MATPDTHPAPLVDADVDISKLDGFMLDTRRLLSSELVALSTPEEFKAAVLLWCRSWQQQPAASLPNDPRVLASFAGVTPQRWAKIKDMALRGFILCSDGRLYHKVLAADANRAWEALRKRHDRTKAATDARRKGRDDDRDDPPSGPRNDHPDDERNDQRDDDRHAPRNEVPTVARDGTGRDGKVSTGSVNSSSGGPRARPAAEARPPADVGNPGLSAIREAVRLGFEERFDRSDRPIPPAEEELFADWIAAGADRGLSPDETAAAVAEEVRRQFRRLEEAGGGPPRSLRAVLDRDVRTAIANARPGRAGGGLKPPPPVPAPYAGHFEPHEFAAWIEPCRISTAGRTAKVEAPSRQVRDWIAQRLEPKFRAALGVDLVEVTVAAPRQSAEVVPLKVGG